MTKKTKIDHPFGDDKLATSVLKGRHEAFSARETKLMKTFDIDSQAKLSAQAQLPSSDAKRADAIEQGIENVTISELDGCARIANGQLDALYEESKPHHVGEFTPESVAINAKASIEAILHKQAPLIQDACDRADRASTEAQIIRFGSAEGRVPNHGENTFLTWVLLAIVLLSEAIVTMRLIAPHARGGISNAFTIALIVPFILGFLGFAAGSSLRYAVHGRGIWKYAGRAGVATSIALAVICNIQFARYRDSLLQGNPSAWDFSWLTRPSTMFEFHDVSSGFLMLTGMASFALVVWKFWGGRISTWDPIPHYSSVWRAHLHAESDCADAVAQCRDQVEQIIDTSIKEGIYAPRHDDIRDVEELERLFDIGAAHCDAGLKAAEDHVRSANRVVRHWRGLLEKYRGANWKRPIYWDSFPTYSESMAKIPRADRLAETLRISKATAHANRPRFAHAEALLKKLLVDELRHFEETIENMRHVARRRNAPPQNPNTVEVRDVAA